MRAQNISAKNCLQRQAFGVVLISSSQVSSFVDISSELYKGLGVKSKLGFTGKLYAFSKHDSKLVEMFPGSTIVSSKEARRDIWKRRLSKIKLFT